jgi:hypothetical protein
MPKIYRVMRKAADDKPVVDASGKGLGVRGLPVNGIVDVDRDENDRIILNGKGMSVSPSWRDLPYFLIPRRLKEKFPGARGAPDLFCFRMGEGAFQDGFVAEGLDLKTDSPKHGNVVPAQLVPLDQYQADLANTRASWALDGD